MHLWKEGGWWDFSLNLLPNLLGFSLGAFAILLAFGNERFQKLLSVRPESKNISKKHKNAAYESVSTGFAHFIIIQFLGIAIAFLAKAWYVDMPDWLSRLTLEHRWATHLYETLRFLFWGLGFLLLCYSLTCCVASTMRMLRLIRKLVEIETNEFDKRQNSYKISAPKGLNEGEEMQSKC